jgi:uroporphyrin-III C-methyltransferase / precorrin-2 dehydrogenase / sirohydrochlorin ferrochelatase
MAGYPLVVELAGRPCVVIGGGGVAQRKVDGLLAAGAVVRVVSPTLTDGLAALARAGRIAHVPRRYRRGDLAGSVLAFVAVGDRRVAAAVCREGRRRGVWVNAADDPARCDFVLPSVLRRGRLLVAVSTAGASPALARVVREEIERQLPAEYATLTDTVAEVRRDLRARGRSPDGATWNRALADTMRDVAGRRADGTRARLLERLGALEPRRVGTVAIVGAGPGDLGLITVRGLELLRGADVVIYDRLVNGKLLDEAPPTARLVFAGKACGAHTLPQHEINARLIAEARAGHRVVRLKGGDAFVFGRGGEEALALADAGIAFEVVPGVTSAVAVPAAAGIPLTHRGVASSFAVVTGHGEADGASRVDWSALARGVDTLVVLMGLGNLRTLAQTLIAHGRDPATPAALVERGTTEAQRTITTTLAELPAAAAAARLEPPVVTVVGPVVALGPLLR